MKTYQQVIYHFSSEAEWDVLRAAVKFGFEHEYIVVELTPATLDGPPPEVHVISTAYDHPPELDGFLAIDENPPCHLAGMAGPIPDPTIVDQLAQ